MIQKLIDAGGVAALTFLTFIALWQLATFAYILGVPGSNFFVQKVDNVIYGNTPTLLMAAVAIAAGSTFGIEKAFKTPRRKIYLYGIVFVIVIIIVGSILTYAAACGICVIACSSAGASMEGCGVSFNYTPPSTTIYCSCAK
ncbi:MAG: hypothetical protein ACK4SY_04510 [Pyrobaculum sp.]